MTGFGSGTGAVAGGSVQFEIRSVNHRYLTMTYRAPAELAHWEAEVRDALRKRFERGYLTVTVRWLEVPATAEAGIDPERARQAVARLRELARVAGVDAAITLDLLARQPDVMVGPDPRPDYAWSEVAPTFSRAAAEFDAARRTEGAVLAQELGGRLDAIDAAAASVATRAPARVERERDRLRAAVTVLLDGRPVDESRMVQEIAFLAEKLDVTEELVRLGSHLNAARAALGSERPVGKQLGFLAQEIGREINTIGSKANDAPIQHLVVEMKGELERFREQLENLE
ncbi:MAG: YicC family protein [Gemmatimonadetes bacterium]|nr:YicC family protein [Gemmatimonadota bacterium]